MKEFAIGEILRASWADFKKSWQGLYVVLIVGFVVSFAFGFVSGAFSSAKMPVVYFVLQILSTVVSWIVMVGIIKVVLSVIDGKKAEISELFFAIRDIKILGKYLASYIISSLVVVGVMLPFVVLGFVFYTFLGQQSSVPLIVILVLLGIIALIFVGVRMQFWLYDLVDKGDWAIEPIRKSWQMTKGHVLNLILFALVLTGINLLGLLALVVGLVVTIPFSMLATAKLYRKLAS